MAGAAAKPCQGDSLEFYLITGSFYTDQRGTVSKIKILDYKHAEGTAKNSQDNKTILLGLPEDIYAVVDSCETAQKIWLRVQQMMKGSDIEIQEKKAKLFSEWEIFTSNEGESIESYYNCFLKLMNDLKRNKHFPKKIARHNVGNRAGYNDVIGNQVNQNAVQNPRVQNVRNQNGLIGVQGNGNQIGNGNLVAARAEGNAAGQNGNQIMCYNCRGVGIQLQAEEYDLMAAAADLDEIKEVNANCILMANLQQASTSGTQTDSASVYDTDGSAEFMRTVRFGNDHVAAILDFGDLQWGNILITRRSHLEEMLASSET
nr:hypothetical protein [Tanacetum cinerariifolium]GEZ59293.1 hypothetical protein [Tanacetum cinerariifolium]